jgi:hypothetical protein
MEERIIVKFVIEVFTKELSCHFSMYLDRTVVTTTLYQSIFLMTFNLLAFFVGDGFLHMFNDIAEFIVDASKAVDVLL